MVKVCYESPEGAELRRVGLAEAVAATKAFLGG